jgi:predicted aspartyl protease
MAWKTLLVTCALLASAAQLGTALSANQADAATSTPTSTAAVCAQPTTSGLGGFRLPLNVKSSRDGTQFIVEVCVAGMGPFPFLVDTGAEQSTITPAIAARLHLPSTGSRQQTAGVGCTTTATSRRIENWSIGGVALSPEVVPSQRIDGLGGVGEPVGLFGADVLSRFGAVRFDFQASELDLPGPEGPIPSKTSEFQGPTKTPVPSVLISGSPQTIPLAVAIGPGFATAVTSVTIGRATGSFLIDTGATQSVVTPRFASRAKLQPTGKHESETSTCETSKVSTVSSGPWSIGHVSLSSEPIASEDLPGGLDGVFGADQLSRFTSAVLAFRSGELLVGPYRRSDRN